MKFTPLLDRVLIKRVDPEVKSAGEELLIMKESDLLGVLDGAEISRKAA